MTANNKVGRATIKLVGYVAALQLRFSQNYVSNQRHYLPVFTVSPVVAEFPWLFSVYMLASAVTVPVYAKLADTISLHEAELEMGAAAVYPPGTVIAESALELLDKLSQKLQHPR